MNVKKPFNIFLQIRGDIRARSLTFRGLSAESLNFPQPRKGVPFRGIILGNNSRITCLSSDYTSERHAFPRYNFRKVKTFSKLNRGKTCLSAERHVIRELFCVKVAFSPVKSVERLTFRAFSFEKAFLSTG
jgi:hypothetical protein